MLVMAAGCDALSGYTEVKSQRPYIELIHTTMRKIEPASHRLDLKVQNIGKRVAMEVSTDVIFFVQKCDTVVPIRGPSVPSVNDFPPEIIVYIESPSIHVDPIFATKPDYVLVQFTYRDLLNVSRKKYVQPIYLSWNQKKYENGEYPLVSVKEIEIKNIIDNAMKQELPIIFECEGNKYISSTDSGLIQK